MLGGSARPCQAAREGGSVFGLVSVDFTWATSWSRTARIGDSAELLPAAIEKGTTACYHFICFSSFRDESSLMVSRGNSKPKDWSGLAHGKEEFLPCRQEWSLITLS